MEGLALMEGFALTEGLMLTKGLALTEGLAFMEGLVCPKFWAKKRQSTTKVTLKSHQLISSNCFKFSIRCFFHDVRS